MTDNQKALDALNRIQEHINGQRYASLRLDTGTVERELPIIKAALTAQTVPDRMVLVKKSSMLEPDFESMGRQILEQARRIKDLEAQVSAQPVTDDEVLSAIAYLEKCKMGTYKKREAVNILIRAATAPKNCDYQEVIDTHDKIQERCGALEKDNNDMHHKIKALVKALEFYADISLYEGISLGVAPVNEDRGLIAQKALAAHFDSVEKQSEEIKSIGF